MNEEALLSPRITELQKTPKGVGSLPVSRIRLRTLTLVGLHIGLPGRMEIREKRQIRRAVMGSGGVSLRGLFSCLSDGQVRCPGIEDHDVRGFVAQAFAPVPGVDHLDNGLPGHQVQNLAIQGMHPQVTAEQNAGIDDRVLVHGEPCSRRNGDAQNTDFRLSPWVGRQQCPIPACFRPGQFTDQNARVFGGNWTRTKEDEPADEQESGQVTSQEISF